MACLTRRQPAAWLAAFQRNANSNSDWLFKFQFGNLRSSSFGNYVKMHFGGSSFSIHCHFWPHPNTCPPTSRCQCMSAYFICSRAVFLACPTANWFLCRLLTAHAFSFSIWVAVDDGPTGSRLACVPLFVVILVKNVALLWVANYC